MIKSMTGYGRAETEINGKKIIVEIKSLNGKQLDLSVRIPGIYRSVEFDLRSQATKRIQRGKADITISYEAAGATTTSATINEKAFTEYFDQLSRIAKGCGIEPSVVAGAVIPSILRMPDVVGNDSVTISETELQLLRNAATAAFDSFDQFRIQEGDILIADLAARISTIETLMASLEPYEAVRVEMVKNRIRENLESLKIPLDSNRLEQEMIYYIEKLDITEEKVRLTNHCSYFRQVVSEEEGIGRKLGFIAQEMGREINTMGSKSNDSQMQKIVVQMKDELEKVKEQLLNIL